MQWTGVKAQVMSGDELREQQPSLSQTITNAVFFPETGHTPNPLKLSETVFESFLAAGGLFKMQKVEQVVIDDVGCQLISNSQEHFFNYSLLTTGAWSKPLVKSATGVSIPLDT